MLIRMRMDFKMIIVVLLAVVYIAESLPVTLSKFYPPPQSEADRHSARAAFENPNYFGGDIVDFQKRTSRNAIPNDEDLWPNGVIPFEIDPKLYPKRKILYDAMNEFHSHTCLKFIPRTTEYDYIYIISLDGCYSYPGKIGGPQIVSLAPTCLYIGTIIHELCHAIGLFHEHQRYDRDDFLIVYDENISDDNKKQFDKMKPDEMRILEPYDYNSIMHYGSKSFSINGKNTMVPRQANATLRDTFDQYGFALSDIKVIDKLYHCAGQTKA